MIGTVLLALVATSLGQPQSDVVFACQYFRSEAEASDGWVHVIDMRVIKHENDSWTLERANEPIVTATEFQAEFGSVGGSVGLRWQDAAGKNNTAYISYSDIKLPGGMEYFWLNFDRPSLWQPPGYGCQSQGDLSRDGA